MSSKRIVIHAGLPKTASTFLQVNVFPFLPESECAYNPPAIIQPLMELCKEVVTCGGTSDATVAELKRVVAQELEKIAAPTVLISVEGLLPLHCGGYNRSDAILSVLKQVVPDPVIVVFLREQSAWIRSAYSFCLVSKFILPFDEYVNRTGPGRFADRGEGLLSVGVFDYAFDTIRELVQRHFNQCRFFSFEQLFSDQQQVLDRLASLLGVPGLRVESGEKVNSGLKEEYMATLSRVLRRFPRNRWRKAYLFTRYARLGPLRKLDFLYLRYTGLLAMALARRVRSEGELFSAGETRLIQDFYREGNRAFWQAEDERWDAAGAEP